MNENGPTERTALTSTVAGASAGKAITTNLATNNVHLTTTDTGTIITDPTANNSNYPS